MSHGKILPVGIKKRPTGKTANKGGGKITRK